MKKLLFLLGIVWLSIGCTGPQGPQGPQGPAGEGALSATIEFTIYSQDWQVQRDGSGAFIGYWYEIPVPELDNYIYKNGLYNTYLIDGNVQIPLPLIVYNETDGTYWEKKISCDYAVGSVAVYYQENDFQNESYRPETMTFRIQLIWS